MRRLAALLIAALLALTGAGCGSSKRGASSASEAQGSQATTTSASGATIPLAKTKFVLHAGLAFGAFHRYIYKPLKSRAFSGGLLHHKLATIKAALAAAFAYHEIKLALADARSSRLLSTLLAPVLAVQSHLASLASRLHGGHVDPAAIESTNASAGLLSAASAHAGQPVSDVANPPLGG